VNVEKILKLRPEVDVQEVARMEFSSLTRCAAFKDRPITTGHIVLKSLSPLRTFPTTIRLVHQNWEHLECSGFQFLSESWQGSQEVEN
jgi:hypothetical protein